MLTAAHETTERHAVSALFLLPLACFVAGLLTLGIGAVHALDAEHQAIRAMEDADTILQVPVGLALRPSEQARLKRIDKAAAIAFAFGLIAGFFSLVVEAVR